MFEIIIILCGLFLSAVGFSTILGCLWVALLKPKKCKKGKLIVLLDGENDIGQIYYYIEKYRWYGSDFTDELYFVYQEELPSDCVGLCERYNNVHFCRYSQFKL